MQVLLKEKQTQSFHVCMKTKFPIQLHLKQTLVWTQIMVNHIPVMGNLRHCADFTFALKKTRASSQNINKVFNQENKFGTSENLPS